jgi:hypothetical protein
LYSASRTWASCFRVDFEADCPFKTQHFPGHGVHSGCVDDGVQPDPKKFYKYTVSVPGKSPKDPRGVVRD